MKTRIETSLQETARKMKPAKVDKTMKDLSNDPYFVKKDAAAREQLAKITNWPKELLTGNK